MAIIDYHHIPLYDSPYSFSQSLIPRTASRLTGGVGVISKKPTTNDRPPAESKQSKMITKRAPLNTRTNTKPRANTKANDQRAESFQLRESFQAPRPATSLNIIAIVLIIICVVVIAGFIYFVIIQQKRLALLSRVG